MFLIICQLLTTAWLIRVIVPSEWLASLLVQSILKLWVGNDLVFPRLENLMLNIGNLEWILWKSLPGKVNPLEKRAMWEEKKIENLCLEGLS